MVGTRIKTTLQDAFGQDAHPRILGLGTALPPYRIGQNQARDLAGQLFAGLPGLSRLIGVFENTGIESRYMAAPLEWYGGNHPFPEKNALWFERALELSKRAAQQALDNSGLEAEDVGAILLVSSTGLALPSLDAYLIQELGLPTSVTRLPLWGLGCAGGAAGLARAAELARLRPGKAVLLVTVELCSLTFIPGDVSKANLISVSLFSDGAAAVVLGMPESLPSIGGDYPEVVGGFTRLLPDSYEVMGWELVEEGFQVLLSNSVPALVAGPIGERIKDGLADYGLAFDDLATLVLHPGGVKVLEAFRTLGADEKSIQASWNVLKSRGNMSSPTVLFVLQERMRMGGLKPGDLGLLVAMGPGFAAEGALLRW